MGVGADGDGHPTVVAGAGIGVVGRHAVVVVALGAGRLAGHLVAEQVLAEEGDHALGLGELDDLALAGPPELEEGEGGGVGAVEGGDGVGEEDVLGLGRVGVAVAADVGVAGGAFEVGAEGAVVGVGAGEAVSGHAEHDDIGLDGAEGVVVDAELVDGGRRVVLDHDVGDGDELLEDLDALLLLEVDGHAHLVLGVALEERPAVEVAAGHGEVGIGVDPVAHGVDVGLRRPGEAPAGAGLEHLEGLDADALGAPIGEVARGVGPGEDEGQVGDADALEGASEALGGRHGSRGSRRAGCARA